MLIDKMIIITYQLRLLCMKTEINHAKCFDVGLARSKLPKNVSSSCCQYYYGYTCRAAVGKFMSALFTVSKPFGMTQGMVHNTRSCTSYTTSVRP